MTSEPRLAEQVAYYRARAAEYDEWALRQGRHDRGDDHRRRWLAEWAAVEATLRELAPYGDTLELAAGTGLWTRVLVEDGQSVTAVDAAPEALAINRGRPGHDRVAFLLADLFDWRPSRRYDLVAFGFWLSHVPRHRLDTFLEKVADAVAPGGAVWFVDSTINVESTARDQGLVRPSDETVRRRLADGSEYEIVKVFHDPGDLETRLVGLGWDASVRPTGSFFYVGTARFPAVQGSRE